MPDNRRDWKRLASHVKVHRVRRGWTNRVDFAHHLGISDKTIGKLEAGQPVGASTLAAIEDALLWSPGSADAILDGGEPTTVASGDLSEPAPHPRVPDDTAQIDPKIDVLTTPPDELLGFLLRIHRFMSPDVAAGALRKMIMQAYEAGQMAHEKRPTAPKLDQSK